MRLLKDRIAVRPEESPDVSAGGVILPEAAREKPVKGEVIAVGPECNPHNEHPARRHEGINIGDTVLFSKYGGVEVEHEGNPVIVLRLSDVLWVE